MSPPRAGGAAPHLRSALLRPVGEGWYRSPPTLPGPSPRLGGTTGGGVRADTQRGLRPHRGHKTPRPTAGYGAATDVVWGHTELGTEGSGTATPTPPRCPEPKEGPGGRREARVPGSPHRAPLSRRAQPPPPSAAPSHRARPRRRSGGVFPSEDDGRSPGPRAVPPWRGSAATRRPLHRRETEAAAVMRCESRAGLGRAALPDSQPGPRPAAGMGGSRCPRPAPGRAPRIPAGLHA